MGLFSSSSTNLERFFPATPSETYLALANVLHDGEWSFETKDDFAMSATFKTGMTAMTYGMNGSAQVMPSGEGSTLSVTVTPKIGGQIRNGANQQRIAEELLAAVSQRIQTDRKTASA